MFSQPFISYKTNERLQEERFHSKNYLEMPRCHAKMRLKSGPQKLNFSKSYIKKLYTRL